MTEHYPGTRGATLVWAHAFLSSVANEDRQGVPAWHDGLDVLRYDARGHGAGPVCSDPAQLDWPALGADMLAVADAHALDGFIAGGVSMGAMTALCAALAAPARVRALVLVSPPPLWQARAPHAQAFARASAVMQRRAVRHPDGAALAMLYAGAAAANLPEPRTLERLRDTPVLIVAWEGDAAHPLASARTLQAGLPRACLVVLAHADDHAARDDAIGLFLRQQGG